MEREHEEYRAYLLRIWRDNEQSSWRASLEDPHSEHLMRFSTMQQLFQFLEKTMHSPLWESHDDTA